MGHGDVGVAAPRLSGEQYEDSGDCGAQEEYGPMGGSISNGSKFGGLGTVRFVSECLCSGNG